LGFEDYIHGNGLTVIEWPDRLGGLSPDDYLNIELLLNNDENSRLAILTPHGNDWPTRTERFIEMIG
jgi:tRNA threonylcarbamoyladenosine biosynthesis protein TsaE